MSDKAVNNAHTEKQIFIVSEAIDGRIVHTRLPKAEAHKLYEKLLDAGADVSIKEQRVIDDVMDEFFKKPSMYFEVTEPSIFGETLKNNCTQKVQRQLEAEMYLMVNSMSVDEAREAYMQCGENTQQFLLMGKMARENEISIFEQIRNTYI